jgi:flavin reductase (DIM6/NTAB) family NADH-FMN oxidoreductase RutF
MIDFQPPLVAIVVGDQSYSFNALKETKECVINIPTVKLISKVISVGNTSGSKIDKFKKFNLSQENALHVKAPIISECYANLECKVIDAKMSSKYNIFILEVLKAWVTPLKKRALTIHHCGNGTFVVDRKVIKIPSNKK